MNTICRLCCNPTNSGNLLFGESGNGTEIYDITVKYFDPLLVLGSVNNFNKSKQLICQECWNHIKIFHEFQQNILLAQANLKDHGRLEDDILLVDDPGIDDISLGYNEDESNNEGNFQEEIVTTSTVDETPLDCDSSKEETEEAVNVVLDRSLKTENRKENLNQRRRGSKLKIINSTKKNSYNSAEKLQELDDFIADFKPELECDICKQNFPNYNCLRSHFTKEHQKKCYVVCCNKKIFRRYILVEHLRLHVNPETYKCDICGANSNSSRSLIVHKKFMHETVQSHECEVCRRKFKNKSILIRHMATHANVKKDFKCNKCGRCYAFEFQMKIHVSKVHDEPKICEQCGKKINGSAALKQHILIQHSEIKLQKWSCDICNTQLSSQKSLKSHKLSFHNDGTTAFICKECGKVAASENALMRHKKFVHQMERKFKCSYCEKAFKKKTNLKEHIATHTGQHLYQCPYCTQTFNNNANMHKHRKRSHPIEWTQSRQNRRTAPKVKPDSIIKEIVL